MSGLSEPNGKLAALDSGTEASPERIPRKTESAQKRVLPATAARGLPVADPPLGRDRVEVRSACACPKER
jgi:hypothetical protein